MALKIKVDFLEVDKTGKVWISESSSYCFASYNGFELNEYYLPDSHASIQSFEVDTNGIVWIGTYEHGIYRFDPNPTAVENKTQSPMSLSITGNYPNPFNGSTLISFQVPERDFCELSIYAMNGQLIKTLVADNINRGGYKVYWNGKNAMNQAVASGVYLARLQIGTTFDTHKITYAK